MRRRHRSSTGSTRIREPTSSPRRAASLRIRPANRKYVRDGRPKSVSNGRQWPRRATLALLSFLVGVMTGYLTDLARIAVPPGVILDSAGGNVLKATVLLERNSGDQGERWLFPGSLSSNRPDVAKSLSGKVSDLKVLEGVLRRANAYDVEVTEGKLIVEGRRNQPIRITELRALVKKRDPPSLGDTVLLPGPQGAGCSHRLQPGRRRPSGAGSPSGPLLVSGGLLHKSYVQYGHGYVEQI